MNGLGDLVIETRALTKRYGDSILAVDDLDLGVRRGEVYGFLGPNGAGKTTTLRMLLGLVRPTSGQAVVLGAPPGAPDGLARIGAMVELPALYPYLSGRDNLRMLARHAGVREDRVEAVLEEVRLTDRASDRSRTYSLGMKQRLGVAAALLKDPELLILDEPTNGLDPAGMAEMRGILLGIWTFLGIFLIPYALDPEDAPGGLEQFFPESLAGTLIAGFPFFGGVFALMLGVFALGSEYAWDTLKTLFTQRPGRLRVLAAKLAALGIVLVPFVLALFAAGEVASLVIAQIEGAPVSWPSAWLVVRAMSAGWLILAAWAALGVLLGVLTRGTSLAIGVGILYALVIEGLLSAFAGSVSVLEPLTNVFLRANGYSIATALGASSQNIESNGPGFFSGPFADSPQALAVLAALIAAFAALSALLLRRRDVA